MVPAGIADETSSCIYLIITEQQHTASEQAHASDRVVITRLMVILDVLVLASCFMRRSLSSFKPVPLMQVFHIHRSACIRCCWLQTDTCACCYGKGRSVLAAASVGAAASWA